MRARRPGALRACADPRSATAPPGAPERWPGSPRGRSPFARSMWGAMSGPPTSIVELRLFERPQLAAGRNVRRAPVADDDDVEAAVLAACPLTADERRLRHV